MAQEDNESQITCLRKELEASLAKNTSLEKENSELRQEVVRLKAQISSLKAHDIERKSMLWKKLQNTKEICSQDASQQKLSDNFKTSEQIVDSESFCASLNSQLEFGKERLAKVPKPPPKPTPAISPPEKGASEYKKAPSVPTPAPPPPPFSSKLLAGSRSVRRVPELVELYRSLTKKDSYKENRINPSATPAMAFTRNMIGEIENRSTYLSAIKSDVKKQKELINFIIKEVQSAVFADISDVEAFVKWVDKELSSLVDERAVLKHFPQWPERKADALREAAFNYRDLRDLESEVSSFEDNPKEPLAQAIQRMHALQDRLEQSVNNMERMRDSIIKRYRDFQIPWEWMLDTGLIGQMKLSSVRLAKEYMKRITRELIGSECFRDENLMLQGVRFAYRVHQFAGGFDVETTHAFEELKKVGKGSQR